MSGEPEELGMGWDVKPLSYYNVMADLDLAYAMNDIHDLLIEVEDLRGQVSGLEYEAEVHECYEDHDYCISQEEFMEVEERLARHIGLFGRLRNKREELYWNNVRALDAGTPFSLSPEEVLDMLTEILEKS